MDAAVFNWTLRSLLIAECVIDMADVNQMGEKAGLQGMRYAPKNRRARGAKKKETGYDLESFDPNSRA